MKVLLARLVAVVALCALVLAVQGATSLQLSDIRLKEIKLLSTKVVAGQTFEYNVILKALNLDDPIAVQVGVFKGSQAVGEPWTVKIDTGRDALKVPDQRPAPTTPDTYILRSWKTLPNGAIDEQETVLTVLPVGSGLPTPLAEYLPISRVAAAVRATAASESVAPETGKGACPSPTAEKAPRLTLFYALGLDGVNSDPDYELQFAVYGPLPSKGSSAALVRRREWTERFPQKTDSMAGKVSVSLSSGSYVLLAYRPGRQDQSMAIGFKVP